MVKNLPASAVDTGLIPGLGRSHVLWSDSAHAAQLLKPECHRALASQQEKLQP